MYRGIIFDMDGVIIDSEPLHHRAEKALLAAYNVTITPEELQTFAGKDAVQLLNGFIDAYRLPVDFATFYTQHKMNVERVFETSEIPETEAVALIKMCHSRHIPLALASSSHRQLIELVLERLQLKPYFQIIIGGDEIDRGKPFPDIYQAAAERLGFAPDQCVAIEDSRNGVHSAKDAGCYCIGYINPNSGNQDLKRADLIIDQFSKIDLKHYFDHCN